VAPPHRGCDKRTAGIHPILIYCPKEPVELKGENKQRPLRGVLRFSEERALRDAQGKTARHTKKRVFPMHQKHDANIEAFSPQERREARFPLEKSVSPARGPSSLSRNELPKMPLRIA